VGPALQCVNELMFALCATFFLGLLLFLNWGPGRPAARYPLASVADASALCPCTVLCICPCPCPYFLVFTYFWFILITPKCRLLLVQKH
jgi:hypothetical protein